MEGHRQGNGMISLFCVKPSLTLAEESTYWSDNSNLRQEGTLSRRSKRQEFTLQV